MAGYVSGGMAIDYADGIGEAVIKGRRWRWEFHDYTGPQFYRVMADGREVAMWYPWYRTARRCHQVWKRFNKWLKRYHRRRRRAAAHETVVV